MHAEATEANKNWGAARLLRFPIDCSIRVVTVILEYSEYTGSFLEGLYLCLIKVAGL